MINIRILLVAVLCLCGFCWPAAAANCNAANGSCFWIGGTGTMDFATDGAHWSNTTGGATCSCEPTSTSLLNFDANSGGGTVTASAGPFTFGGTAGGFILTGFTGTLDFATNNPNVTISTSTFFISDASATHTLNMGSGTWTLTSTATSGTIWATNNASLTLNAGSSTINFNSTGACNASVLTVTMGGKTYGTVSFTSTAATCTYILNQANTFGHLTLTGPVYFQIPGTNTQTVSNAFTWTGTAGNEIGLFTSSSGTTATMSVPNGSTGAWVSLRDIIFTTGAPAFTNCFNLGHNTLNGGSCAAPSGGGGG